MVLTHANSHFLSAARRRSANVSHVSRGSLFRGSLFAAILATATAGCAPAAPPAVPAITVARADGNDVAFPKALEDAPYTVLIFYADACPCFRVHDERIRALASTYGPRGVRFYVVDSEVGATPERDAAASRERNLPPILIDRGAKLADALGAEYATYSVVLDREGHVRYRGGIDSDKTHLTDGATPYLRNAVDDLLAGHDPKVAEGKALGCSLQTR